MQKSKKTLFGRYNVYIVRGHKSAAGFTARLKELHETHARKNGNYLTTMNKGKIKATNSAVRIIVKNES